MSFGKRKLTRKELEEKMTNMLIDNQRRLAAKDAKIQKLEKDEAEYLSRRAQEAENAKHGLEAELKQTAEILEETREMIGKENEIRITAPKGMRPISIYFGAGEEEEE